MNEKKESLLVTINSFWTSLCCYNEIGRLVRYMSQNHFGSTLELKLKAIAARRIVALATGLTVGLQMRGLIPEGAQPIFPWLVAVSVGVLAFNFMFDQIIENQLDNL